MHLQPRLHAPVDSLPTLLVIVTFPDTYLKVVLPRLPPLHSTVVAPQTKHLEDVQRVRMASEALPLRPFVRLSTSSSCLLQASFTLKKLIGLSLLVYLQNLENIEWLQQFKFFLLDVPPAIFLFFFVFNLAICLVALTILSVEFSHCHRLNRLSSFGKLS